MGEVVLRLDGVGRGFRRGRRRWRVLVGVSLSVSTGEVVGVVGARGEGKTTLLEVAAGIELPDEGHVWFDGEDLTICSAEERAELLGGRISWMHREGMGGFRVLDYVGMPLAMGRGRRMNAADDLALEALRRFGVEGCARRGWDELSNWERLLVMFARGFVGRPRLVVIDDLLDGLGPRRTREASEMLLSVAQELGCGVLVGASDFEAVLLADRVLCFDGSGGLQVMSDPANVINLPHGRQQASGRRQA
jgi:ABC-type cobalamin/Fe3+-siderophores transport system ATPase subunit